jgi:hypothetical protein
LPWWSASPAVPRRVGPPIPVVRWHLTCFTGEDSGALVFISPDGMPLRHANFRRRVWLPAIRDAKVPPVHFHDLRHTGNTLAARARGQPPRADGADGPRQRTRRADLPALQQRGPAPDRRQSQPARPGGAEAGQQAIGHTTGTEPETGLVIIASESPETRSHQRRKGCARARVERATCC